MTTTERDESIVHAEPTFAAEMLANVLDGTWWDDAVMLGGWSIGARAFAERCSLTELTMRVAAMEARALPLHLERAAEGEAIDRRAAMDAASAVSAAAALLHQAAVQAFSLAAVRALEGQARDLRHELRNPIGTIRNSLTMLQEDATAPSGSDRSGDPRQLHAIALRGTALLETLVRERLSGAIAADALLGRAVQVDDTIARVLHALATRARASGVAFDHAQAAHAGTVCARLPGLDLVLRSVAIAAVRTAADGSSIAFRVESLPSGRSRIRVQPEQPSRGTPDVLDPAQTLSARAGLAISGRFDDDGLFVDIGGDGSSVRQ